MSEISLEKIDLIRERTGVSYSEAKTALEACNGDVVNALIYIENNKNSFKDDIYTTKDEFIKWIRDLIKKGNITRIKVKKEDKVLLDIPVNTGVAATGIAAIILPYAMFAPLVAVGIFTAVFTKITVEITKQDGTVKVVNKIIKNTVNDVKDKMEDFTDNVKDKVDGFTSEVKEKFEKNNQEEESNVYQYTVKFEDIDEEK